MSMDDAIGLRIPSDSDLALSLRQRESSLWYTSERGGMNLEPVERLIWLDSNKIVERRNFTRDEVSAGH